MERASLRARAFEAGIPDADIASEAELTRALEAFESSAVIVTRGDVIKPAPINWRWPGWLAAGKLHILAGAPGTGKTTLALAFAAALTTGGRWPDGTHAPTGNVLIVSYEDDPADTLVPRLAAMGANMARVYFLGGVFDGEYRAFQASKDLGVLRDKLRAIGDVGLVVVDPVVSAMGMVDSHKNLETRQALQPLADLASTTGSTVIGITHLAKGTAARDPLERMIGSIAFGALARIVIGAAKVDSGNGPTRIMARIKSNIGLDDGGFEYVLTPTVAHEIETVAVQWGSAVEGTARELLGVPDDTGRQSAEEEAVDWLRSELAAGPVSPKTLQPHAKRDGHSWITVRRAKEKLGVVSRKERVAGGGWQWWLPEDAPREGAQNLPISNEHLHLVHGSRASKGFQPREVARDIEGAQGEQVRGCCPRCGGEGCDWCVWS